MAKNEFLIPRTKTVSGVEYSARLLSRGHCVTPPARPAPQIETHADQPVLEVITMDDGGQENFHAVAIRVVSEERPALLEATGVKPLTSEPLAVCDALAGILSHVKEALTRMITEPNANSSGKDSQLAALLERLVLQAVDKVLRTPVTLRTFTEAILDNPKHFCHGGRLCKVGT